MDRESVAANRRILPRPVEEWAAADGVGMLRSSGSFNQAIALLLAERHLPPAPDAAEENQNL